MAPTPSPTPPTWRSPAQIAEHLGVSMSTVTRAIADGSLPSFKWRGKRLVDLVAADRAVMRGQRRHKLSVVNGG